MVYADSTYIWVGIVGAGAAASLTVTFNATINAAVNVAEYSGLDTSNLIDQTASANGQGTNTLLTGTTLLTSQAKELFVGSISSSSNTNAAISTPINGFNLADGAPNLAAPVNGYLDKIASAAETAKSGVTRAAGSTFNEWAGLIVTLRAAAPPPTVPITFDSNPTDLELGCITINGTSIATPYTIPSATVGDVYWISAHSPVNVTTGQSQYVFNSWNDSGDQSHFYIVSVAKTVTANFTLQYPIIVTYDLGSIITPNGTVWVNASKTQSFSVGSENGYIPWTQYIDGSAYAPSAIINFSDVKSNHTIYVTSQYIGGALSSPIETSTPSVTPSPIGLTEVVLLVVFLFFTLLAFISKEPFVFGLTAFISIIFGADIALLYLNDTSNWVFAIIGFGLILFGLWMVAAAFEFSMEKGGKNK